MKQHISPSQLQELTEEQQERLREWWKIEEGHWFAVGDSARLAVREAHDIRVYDISGTAINKHWALPLLSIGQMIELLHEKGKLQEIFPAGGISSGGAISDDWNVRIYEPFHLGAIHFIDNELADALWEAVKEVL